MEPEKLCISGLGGPQLQKLFQHSVICEPHNSVESARPGKAWIGICATLPNLQESKNIKML